MKCIKSFIVLERRKSTLIFFCLLLISSVVVAHPQSKKHEQKEIIKIATKVCDWQLQNLPDSAIRADLSKEAIPGHSWVRAAFYTGLMANYRLSGNKKYLDNALQLAEGNEWKPGPRTRHADDLCIGQTYLELYRLQNDKKKIGPIQEAIDQTVADPQRGVDVGRSKLKNWSWCDALFMAPPVFALLSAETGDSKYLETMDVLWMDTYNLLYDKTDSLYYRDINYKIQADGTGPRTKNGQKVLWSRGNGWVMGGLVRVLEYMPNDYPRRDFYVSLYLEMVNKIARLQGLDGLWRTSLLDADEFPAPDVSGTAFFCYAIAWGINKGLLNADEFLPIVNKAWSGMVWAVNKKSGKLGWVQRIGHEPVEVKAEDTMEYGVGAFLLAAEQMVKLAVKKQ